MTGPAGVGRADPRTLAPLGRRRAGVVGGQNCGAYRLVWAADPEGPPSPRPGQFYMLATVERWGAEDGRPYLPRAFSHARVVSDGGVLGAVGRASTPGTASAAPGPRLAFLVDPVGPGTERLAALAHGEELWLSGPFGAGFRLPAGDGVRPILVGGGIGTAPILALADELGGAPVLLGFRTAEHAAVSELFDPRPIISTDDGSLGRHALVTDLLREELERRPTATVYACGPPPMLEAVRALCAARGTPAQLALESGMACGYGACFGCVVPTRDGFVRLCLDGPVLDAGRLETALFEGAGH